MGAIVKLLREEIDRLKAERTILIHRKVEFVGSLDICIAAVDQRLGAAERMLTAYTAARPASADAAAAPHDPDDVDLAWIMMGAVDIPPSLKGHRLRPTSKKARIIRATISLLEQRGTARRSEILAILQELGIMKNERNPKAYLSVILSCAGEIFASNRRGWYLRKK